MDVFKVLSTEDCNRGKPDERPPIPFVPQPSKLQIDSRHEFQLRINPTESKGTFKKYFYVLSTGTSEYVLNWALDVKIVLKNKPCDTAESRFDLTEVLLAGDAKAT